MEIEKILMEAKPFCKEVKTRLHKLFENEEKHRHIDFNGKMLRPALVYFTGLSLNSTVDNDKHFFRDQENYHSFLDFAVAIELLHNASLVHDDILDEDEYRRGVPTLNNKIGNKKALLLGNILYLHSFGLSLEYLNKEQSVALVNTAMTMCLGELTQMNLQDIVEIHIYEEIIKQKTGLLTAISCSEVARIAGVAKEDIENFHEIGLNIGCLYQIFDDIKDKDTSGNAEKYMDVLFGKYMKAFEVGINKLQEGMGKTTFYGIQDFFKYKYNEYQQREG